LRKPWATKAARRAALAPCLPPRRHCASIASKSAKPRATAALAPHQVPSTQAARWGARPLSTQEASVSVKQRATQMTTLAKNGTSVALLSTIVGSARVALASQKCKIAWMDATLVFLPPVRILAQRRGIAALAPHQVPSTQAARWGARRLGTQEASVSVRPRATKMTTLAIGTSVAFLRTIVGGARVAVASQKCKSVWMVASLALGLRCLSGIIGMELQ